MLADDGRLSLPLDEDEVTDLLVEIDDHDLPPPLADLVESYQIIEDARPPFMWKWVHRLAPQNTLPCVDPEYDDVVPVDKTLTILFVTLLDDALEKRRDWATFRELTAIPFEHRTADPDRDGVDADYVAFAARVWETLVDRLRTAPEYETYGRLFRFDVKQAINAIEYTDLAISQPAMATLPDLRRYESHNMAMFAYADIDLMHTTTDVSEDFSRLREAIWIAQQMARIGNWVSTWEREVREGDFSAGPVVYALERDIVTWPALRDAASSDEAADRVVDRIREAGVEDEFLARWRRHHDRLQELDDDLAVVDLEPFVGGTEEVLRYHLASTGLK